MCLSTNGGNEIARVKSNYFLKNESYAHHQAQKEYSFLDKISDIIPGQAGEKIENFVKGAADKEEDVFDAVIRKSKRFI